MASAKASWSEENFTCPICLDVFSSPVTTPCGHNFCRTCITKYWDDQVKYKCPVCNELFFTRPDLRVNILLSDMIDLLRTTVRVEEEAYVEPGEVPCDVCTGIQLKAVKSCLVCFASYCQTHLEPHQRVAGLMKHRLVEPMDRLEDRMCKKHDRLLELFCQTDQVCVCQFCTETDHKSHLVVPLKEQHEVKTAQLGKMEAEVPQMIQERKLKIQEIKDTVDVSKKDADREIADGGKVFASLICSVEKQRDGFNQAVNENLKSTEKQAEDLIKELEQEIEDLTNRSSEVKPLSHIKDHLHFLQALRSLKDPPPTRDWTSVEVRPPSYVGTLRRSLDQLEDTLNMEMKKLRDAEPKRVQPYAVDVPLDPDTAQAKPHLSEDVKPGHCGGAVKKLPNNMETKKPPNLQSGVKQYACELTLDQNTVHRHLSLSQDNRRVMQLGKTHRYPDHPERFDYHRQVLCREGLAGRCYWEVEWEGEVDIGVTYIGMPRRGMYIDSALGQNTYSWSIHCVDNDGCEYDYWEVNCSAWGTTSESLPVPYSNQHSNRVGVYLHESAGILSFYSVSPDVGGKRTHIHTFHCTFNQDLYPGFRLYGSDSTVSLCRL